MNALPQPTFLQNIAHNVVAPEQIVHGERLREVIDLTHALTGVLGAAYATRIGWDLDLDRFAVDLVGADALHRLVKHADRQVNSEYDFADDIELGERRTVPTDATRAVAEALGAAYAVFTDWTLDSDYFTDLLGGDALLRLARFADPERRGVSS